MRFPMIMLRIEAFGRCVFALVTVLCINAATSVASDDGQHIASAESNKAYEAESQNYIHGILPHVSSPSLPNPSRIPAISEPVSSWRSDHCTTSGALRDLRSALDTMQGQYFSLWLGKWTTAIDWTAAVMGTYMSATLTSLSRSIDHGRSRRIHESSNEARLIENEINKYFGQSTASYFGEETFEIRMQAFDDMLWVVLEWLESIKFIKSHSSAHHVSEAGQARWHAEQFIPIFAHRARIFHELAKQGWDWRLCGGGMTWNPRLNPYKNAITNQLFISASVNMYLHFPGDNNCSPLLSAQNKASVIKEPNMQDEYDCDEQHINDRGRRDPIFLQSAINGYDWLRNSHMLNDQGLYTDGFHIRDYRTNKSATECNDRNEMVYTYNQGVILSGLRGLWEATGNPSYLRDGHDLVANVIAATGHGDRDDKWHGLGSQGILTERCDPSASCNQDGQAFKGIFFHHLTTFCQAVPHHGSSHATTEESASWHTNECRRYTPWVVHNAKAALATRDPQGRFGSWWNPTAVLEVAILDGARDYRNVLHIDERMREERASGDPNDRGRGRTVETQGGGVAVVRAMYEFMKLG
ncbi:glycosyl hydrolase family 76-domain-containing protein [Ampelomyces quisqualis]|uniref:Glycosyl hydrolase family 76-domain-containing protein n=1 Tax=Ampelomyces quisqualis TaxID=50730 RepID=A0A6A5QMQ6_AMPQU|nr:glycosyl hydrolase family 76-domain-containing protein [Ampelomyces quisqualis]